MKTSTHKTNLKESQLIENERVIEENISTHSMNYSVYPIQFFDGKSDSPELPILFISEYPIKDGWKVNPKKNSEWINLIQKLDLTNKNYLLEQEDLWVRLFRDSTSLSEQICFEDIKGKHQLIEIKPEYNTLHLFKQAALNHLQSLFDSFAEQHSALYYRTGSNFVQQPEIWVNSECFLNDNQFAKWKRTTSDTIQWFVFSIVIHVNRFGIPLSISFSYKGLRFTTSVPVSLTEDVLLNHSKFIFQNKIYNRNQIQQVRPDDFTQELLVHPKLNREELTHLRIPFQANPKEKIQYRDSIFIKAFLKFVFKSVWQNGENHLFTIKKTRIVAHPFISLDLDSIQRSQLLQFANGELESSAYTGLKKHGPFKRIEKTVELILISSKQAGEKALEAWETLRRSTLWMAGVRLSQVHHLTYEDLFNPVPEIGQQLDRLQCSPNTQPLAFVFHPFLKQTLSTQEWNTYYLLSSLLFRKGIPVQFLGDNRYLDPNFRYYFPNLAAAINAKLGGIPWKVQSKRSDDLIVGIGLFQSIKDQKKYTGIVVGMNGEGQSIHQQAFKPQEKRLVIGAIQYFVRQFVKEQQHRATSTKRLVIHVYKPLNSKEMRDLYKALRELGVSLKVIICTIYESRSSDFYVNNMARPLDLLPPHGSVYRISNHEFLVYANDLMPNEMKTSLKSYPRPIRIRVVSGSKEELSDIEMKGCILQLLQFCRINYRSVASQVMPVTVMYSKLFAEKMAYLEDSPIRPEILNSLFML